MSTPLRLRAALGPPAGDAVALRFNSAGMPPIPPIPEPPRGDLVAGVSAPWRSGAPVSRSHATAWHNSQSQAGVVRAPWASTVGGTGGVVRAPWASTVGGTGGVVRAPWASTVGGTGGVVRAPWHQALAAGGRLRVPWQTGAPTARAVLSRWQAGLGTVRQARAPWQSGRPTLAQVRTVMGGSTPAAVSFLAPWDTGLGVVSYGGPWVPLVPLVPPDHVCYLPPLGGVVALRFGLYLPASLGLRFICLDQRHPVVVPIRRVYMVTNTTALTRVSDGANVPCLGMSLSLDSDSWAWGFSATLPADALALIEPGASGEPIELDAEINGQHIRVIAESVSRERVFGQAGVRVQGRGKTAVLDAPYSALTTFDNASAALTTQQLLDQALPSGWTADYGLTPWLVPAGVWSHQGTVMSAALAIAAAGGGYVQPHMTANSIRVLPRYPVAPWGWAGVTPDYELPSAVMTREAIEWSIKPVYNRVYVSGTYNGGKLVRVTRAGSAGDLLARLVADPLITHVDGGRQHGLPILANVGVQARVSLRLPVLLATGIVVPGKMIRYVDGGVARLGLSRSISVEVALAQVWQTIGVETHVL